MTTQQREADAVVRQELRAWRAARRDARRICNGEFYAARAEQLVVTLLWGVAYAGFGFGSICALLALFSFFPAL